MSSSIPLLSWLPHYDRSWLTFDIIAGLTLWGLGVPEAMAYAGIAGLPPQAGLNTLLASLLIYALLGTSLHLVVQAASVTAAATALLGRIPGVPGLYSHLSRHPENMPVPGVLIVRTDAQLYYANALTIQDRIKAMLEEMESPPRAVIFDSISQDEIDVTSADQIKSLAKERHGKGIELYLAEVHAPVLEHARKTGLLDFIGQDHVFPTVDLAVGHIEEGE